MAAKSTLFVLILLIVSVLGQNLVVETTQGLVRGISATDGDYSMYLGIPYAEVAQNNPFGHAIPHSEFDGIFEANDDSHICPQREEFNNTLVGDLDCLRLNIFTPTSASPSNKLPVLVWIYGGGYQIGFYGRYLYGPKYLVRHDIIVVFINYRIGAYGFMCLDTAEVPGNQGLKDQLLALRWVKENIEAFGGDPDKITISGNSAGSMAVEYHLLREKGGEKLFDKAILQSGTTFINSNNIEKDVPLQIADHMGLQTDDISEALAFLATFDPLLIIQAVEDLSINFGPCVEKEIDGVESFILENPVTITEMTIKDIPIIVGFNDDETYPIVMGSHNSVANVLALEFDVDHEDFSDMADLVRQFFYGDEEIGPDTLQCGVDLRSDVTFIYPSIRSMNRFIENEAKVYLYVFSYVGLRNFVKDRTGLFGGGAWHADEVGYLFDISYMGEPNTEDQLMVDRMTTLWANFVKTGDPTPGTSVLLPHKWEAISKGSPRHFLNIDLDMSAGTSPLNERMTFWDVFFEANGHMELALRNTTSTSR